MATDGFIHVPNSEDIGDPKVDNVIVDTSASTGVYRQRVHVANLPDATLTARMFQRAPAEGYSLWLDTADATYIYIAEAPTAATGSQTTFRGIRVTKDASGNPLGKVEQADGFAWDSRGIAGWT